MGLRKDLTLQVSHGAEDPQEGDTDLSDTLSLAILKLVWEAIFAAEVCKYPATHTYKHCVCMCNCV